MKRKIYLLILSLFSVSVFGEPLSLRAALDIALEKNFGIQILRNNELIDKNNALPSWFLPQLSAVGSTRESVQDSRRTDATGTNKEFVNSPSSNLSASVNLDWRLFDGLAMFATQEKMQQYQALGRLKTQMGVEQLIVQVASAYYQILGAEQLTRSSQTNLEMSNERYRIAEQKKMIGSLSGLEINQAKMDLNADSALWMRQEQTLYSAYIDLNRLMNSPDLYMRQNLGDTIVLLTSLDVKQVQLTMLENNTTLQMIKRNERISKMDLRVARANYFPRLDFNTGYSFSSANTPASITVANQNSGFSVGFSVSVPLFNGLETTKKVKNAKVNLENAALTYRETEQELLADLAQLYNQYESSLRMVALEMQNFLTAEKTLSAAMERYRLGSLSGLEFREFQRSFLDASVRKENALFQSKVNELSIQLISGLLSSVVF